MSLIAHCFGPQLSHSSAKYKTLSIKRGHMSNNAALDSLPQSNM